MTSHKRLRATNDALWDAEDKMGDIEHVLYRISQANPADIELRELERRFYRLWSDYLNYLDRRPETAERRAEVEWLSGRARRTVLSRLLGDDLDTES